MSLSFPVSFSTHRLSQYKFWCFLIQMAYAISNKFQSSFSDLCFKPGGREPCQTALVSWSLQDRDPFSAHVSSSVSRGFLWWGFMYCNCKSIQTLLYLGTIALWWIYWCWISKYGEVYDRLSMLELFKKERYNLSSLPGRNTRVANHSCRKTIYWIQNCGKSYKKNILVLFLRIIIAIKIYLI